MADIRTSKESAAQPPAAPRWRLSVDRQDTTQWITRLTLAGVGTAVVFALIGGFPFDTPMPTHAVGWVEPTCGLTRGSTAIARGDFALAWHYNPAAFLVMAFGVLGVIRALVGWSTGRWVNVVMRPGKVTYAFGAAAFVALWFYQQQHAEFIINSRA